MKPNDNKSLAYTTWNCKHHIVFAPKYRRKIFYEDKRFGDRRNTEKVMRMEKGGDHRGKGMPEPYSYAGRDTTEDECFQFCGFSQGKE